MFISRNVEVLAFVNPAILYLHHCLETFINFTVVRTYLQNLECRWVGDRQREIIPHKHFSKESKNTKKKKSVSLWIFYLSSYKSAYYISHCQNRRIRQHVAHRSNKIIVFTCSIEESLSTNLNYQF